MDGVACQHDAIYFILPWRFNILPGCHIHNCKFEDCCPHCNQPLFLTELCSGTLCPKCKGDLSASEAVAMLPDQNQSAANVFFDLEYLLTPQGHEDNSSVPMFVGQELADIRKSQNRQQKLITKSLNFPANAIRAIESATWGRNSFTRYWKYGNALGINFRELFTAAIKNSRLKRELWTADELLEEVNRVYPLLTASHERVTQQMIADEIGVTVNMLRGPKKVRKRLAEIAALYR